MPIALNLRYPISERWLVGALGVVLYLALAVALVVTVARRRERPILLLAVLATFPFIYAWFPGAWFVGEGRYALFVAPVAALTVAWIICRPDALVAIAAVSAAVSFIVVRPISSEFPRHLGSDVRALHALGVDHAWADYWLAYRLTFESDSAIEATPYRSSRDRDLFAAARRDPTPTFLYRKGDRRARRLDRALTVPHSIVRTPHFVVILVDTNVDPATLDAAAVP